MRLDTILLDFLRKNLSLKVNDALCFMNLPFNTLFQVHFCYVLRTEGSLFFLASLRRIKKKWSGSKKWRKSVKNSSHLFSRVCFPKNIQKYECLHPFNSAGNARVVHLRSFKWDCLICGDHYNILDCMQEHRSLDMEVDKFLTPPHLVLVSLECSVVVAHPWNKLGEA